MSGRTGRIWAVAIGAAALVALTATPAFGLEISVSGNHLVDGSGKPVRLIGVNRSGSEYSCSGPDGQGGHGYGFFQGPVSDKAIAAMRTWKVNAVALPLNEACWLGGYAGLNPKFSGEPYRAAIEAYVNRLNAHGIYVVLRLSGAGPDDDAYGAVKGNSESPMADADHALDFWTSLASRFKDNHAVLFHAYDEPHKVSWDCVLRGCEVNANGSEGEPRFGRYQAVGHQAIVDAIRSTGATQPIIVSGIDFAGDLSKWQQFMPSDPLGALVVGWNSFDFTHNFSSSKADLTRLAKSHPIVVGGFGDSDCNSDFSTRLMKFADARGISYLAWTWNTVADYGGCDNNALLGPKVSAYFSGHPSGFGRGIRKHFRKVQRATTKRDAFPTDPMASQEQPLRILHVGQAVGAAGHLQKVTVMTPDTGLDLDHPDIAPNLFTLKKSTLAPNQYPGQFPNVTIPAGAHGYDMIGNDCNPANENPDFDPNHPPGCSDHGTLIDGVLGAAWNNGVGGAGVAPNARFIALRTCWDGDQCYDHIQPPAIEWAAKRGARVISLSWLAERNPKMNRVIKKNPRTLFVTIPSGNGGAFNADPQHPQPCSIDAPNVICVSVSAPDNGLDCAAYGPKDVDVAVPTENSVTTLNGGGFGGTGCATSFASPEVAGVAAILFGIAPKANGAQVKRAIMDGARRVRAWHDKSVTGGIVNAARSVTLIKRRF